MKVVYIAGGAIAVVAWLAVGLVVARGPQPEIVVPAEVITKLGPLNITNTLITSWIVMVLLIVFTFLATRSMKLMPSGFQNFVEAVVGFLVDQIEEIAGEKNGRRFFVLVATIFIFVISCNWFGLLPFFNAIGKTEDVGHEIFHEISSEHPEELELGADGKYAAAEKFAAWKMDKSGGIVFTKPGGKAVDFTVRAGETPGEALDRYIVFLAESLAGFEPEHDIEAAAADPADVRQAFALLGTPAAKGTVADAPRLITVGATPAEGEHGLASPALDASFTGVSFEDGQQLALVIPFFRGVNSDVNNTLALALISFVMIEFWGLRTLGFGYLKKFFDFRGVMPFFIGFLELLSEFIRIISFAFRLFGNVFAGEVLILMLTFLMPFLFVDIIYGLELFVGFIQAAVFALLTLVFASMAVEHHGEDAHHEDHQGEDATADAHHHPGAAQVP